MILFFKGDSVSPFRGSKLAQGLALTLLSAYPHPPLASPLYLPFLAYTYPSTPPTPPPTPHPPPQKHNNRVRRGVASKNCAQHFDMGWYSFNVIWLEGNAEESIASVRVEYLWTCFWVLVHNFAVLARNSMIRNSWLDELSSDWSPAPSSTPNPIFSSISGGDPMSPVSRFKKPVLGWPGLQMENFLKLFIVFLNIIEDIWSSHDKMKICFTTWSWSYTKNVG